MSMNWFSKKRLWQVWYAVRQIARYLELNKNRRPRPRHRPHLPQGKDGRHLQHRRLQRVEEHRHNQGCHQDR